MLARLLAHYPTGSLISELMQIYEGKFVVRAEVQVDGVTRATGMACAENLELAEDRARSRALMVLLTEPSNDAQPELPASHPTGTSEVQSGVQASRPESGVDKNQTSAFATTIGWNNSTISSIAAVPMREESTLSPAVPPELTVKNNGDSVAATPLAQVAKVTSETNDRMYDPQLESSSEAMLPTGEQELPQSYNYSHEENVSEAEPQTAAEVRKPVNMTEAFAQTSAELKRLDWNTQQGRNYLKKTYGKTSRQQLTDNELLEFLEYLESQPTPNQLPLE